MAVYSSLIKSSHIELIHIPRQLAHAIFVSGTLTIAHPAEPICAPLGEIEVFGTKILQAFLEMQDGARVCTGHDTRCLPVLIPGAAVVCPHHAFQELLRVSVEVSNGRRFRSH